MDEDHRPKLSVLDAFCLDGAYEDGLTDSRRSVFTEALVPVQRLPPVPPPEPSSVVVRAQRTFDRLGMYVPARIANEQMGDALELIHTLVREGAPKWKVRAKVASTTFWVLAHTGLELVLRVAGAVKKALGP
ncbi:hypothetical protein [Archangium sp.]|jgi:hypothetical protein|uniref:hypothetical protein n=1 Tax=Archangium sp. TaxID=1872627 RepID=UPI002ED9F407